jgi:hypothetical protein
MSGESREVLVGIHSKIELAKMFFQLLSRLEDFTDVSTGDPYMQCGVDGIATRKTGPDAASRLLFELEHASWHRRVTERAALEAIARFKDMRMQPGYTDAGSVFVTDSYPTLAARDLCEQSGIEVWDRDVLAELLDRAGGVRPPIDSVVR